MARIGAFEIAGGTAGDCDAPYVLAALRPWIDANGVGSLVLRQLKDRFGALPWGELAKPGRFYDFTRYRPVIRLEDGVRDMDIPTTTIYRARRENAPDLLLLRLLEPHNNAEFYISSVVRLLMTVKARRYVLLGSMFDAVPHTRPIVLSGYGMGARGREDAKRAGALPITYSGPSSMLNLIGKEAAEKGIGAAVFIVSLPQYVALDEDHIGKLKLLETLSFLYDIPVAREDFDLADEQRKLMEKRAEMTPEVMLLLPQLERAYDERVVEMGSTEDTGFTGGIDDMIWKISGKDIGKA